MVINKKKTQIFQKIFLVHIILFEITYGFKKS